MNRAQHLDTHPSPLARSTEVDRVSDGFEAEWAAGRDSGPRITWTWPPRRPREPRGWWNCCGSRCRLRRAAGEQPALEEFLGRFPGDADAIRDLFCPPTVTVSRRVESSERIGKYEVIRPLGRGGQAETYLCFDPDLKRQVVLKLFHAAQAPDEQDLVLRKARRWPGCGAPSSPSAMRRARGRPGVPGHGIRAGQNTGGDVARADPEHERGGEMGGAGGRGAPRPSTPAASCIET